MTFWSYAVFASSQENDEREASELYLTGRNYELHKDTNKAFEFYSQAAKKNYILAKIKLNEIAISKLENEIQQLTSSLPFKMR